MALPAWAKVPDPGNNSAMTLACEGVFPCASWGLFKKLKSAGCAGKVARHWLSWALKSGWFKYFKILAKDIQPAKASVWLVCNSASGNRRKASRMAAWFFSSSAGDDINWCSSILDLAPSSRFPVNENAKACD